MYGFESTLLALRLYQNIHLAAELRQHPHDALGRYVPEAALEHPGQVGLADARDPGSFRLGQLLFFQNVLDPAHEFSFEQMCLCAGKTQIGEDILRAAPNGGNLLLSHAEPLVRVLWSSSASFKRRRRISISSRGVLTPFFDFFWNACRTYTALSNFTAYTARYVPCRSSSTNSTTPALPNPFNGFAETCIRPVWAK